MKKKIILAITADVKLYECFVNNLNQLGFEVLLLCYTEPFKYRDNLDRIINFLRKAFLNDKLHKKELHRRYTTSFYLDILNNTPNDFDYAFFIRPDLFNEQIIKLVKEKSTSIYAYQWDGLNRYKDVFKTIPLFDKFYVFDKNDLDKNENVSILNNFYFDCYDAIMNVAQPQYDVYFVCKYDDRIENILNICVQLHNLGLKLNIVIKCSKSKVKKLKKYPYVTVIHQHLSYKENLENTANAKILLDVGHFCLHKGLSFRPFEALGNDKKLITTNSSIKDYDFYNPNNILIYDDNSDLINFINTNYTPIAPEIKKKYSFTNWINYVLEQKTPD
ncbi:hypothetical protein [Flavobacterium marginilacus]|uniref:hypothetical protein n=1 Tax=Flavobacterium marginilacus TaxID=3003256 RepID=UPI00248EC89F|nr:hypothetical protein [Flavobacterium marginilacus]